MAREAGAVIIDFRNEDVYDPIQELTGGRGADACTDAVGTEPERRSWFCPLVDRHDAA